MNMSSYAIMVEFVEWLIVRYHVKGFTEVQYYHVRLPPGIVGLGEVMQCGYQLCLTGVAGSEAVISVCQYVVPLQMVSEVSADDVFKKFAGY